MRAAPFLPRAATKLRFLQAKPDVVKSQLLSEGLELEEYGGDVQVVLTAAKSGQGLAELEEALLLQVGGGGRQNGVQRRLGAARARLRERMQKYAARGFVLQVPTECRVGDQTLATPPDLLEYLLN